MPLPLLLSLPLPGPVAQLRIADVDGDGVEELVVATQPTAQAPPGAPTPLTLTVARLNGEAFTTTRHQLPASASWWDAGHGLWVADAEGLRTIQGRRLHAEPTLLPVGPATPAQATLVADLDGDSRPELLLWGRAGVTVLGVDGTAWGTVPAAPQTRLEARATAGGQVLAMTLLPPPVATGDVDADGDLDLLVVHRDQVSVHRVAPGQVAAAAHRWPKPAVLDTPEDQGLVTDAHWQDLDADGFVDLLVHRVATDGRLAGTQAELHLFRGSAAGLAAPQVLATGAGSQHAFPVDLDGDGDLDVLLPQVSLDVGNLAQAVLSRSVSVSLVAHHLDQGRLQPGVKLHSVSLPLEGQKSAWCMFGDHDGDGLVDLATVVDGVLRVHRGQGDAVERRAWVELPVSGPVTDLWARDLTGDGVDELVGWAPGQAGLFVVRLR